MLPDFIPNVFRWMANRLRRAGVRDVQRPAASATPPMPPRRVPGPAKLPEWYAEVSGFRITARARTKSEARAVMKNYMGLKRLPPGTRVERVQLQALAVA